MLILPERYEWITVQFPILNWMILLIDLLAGVSPFDKEALVEAKRQVNRESLLPDDAQLFAAGTVFVRMLTRPDTQAHISKLMSLDFQQRGEFELRLGHYLGAE
jgi:hypothetical protein